MSENEITVLTDVVLITCIVQRGKADDIVLAAQAAGASGATVHFAKGSGIRERLGILGVAVEVEKEVISILSPTDHADHIFETMHKAAQLDTPGMGFMYITPVEKAATYIPPAVLARLRERQ